MGDVLYRDFGGKPPIPPIQGGGDDGGDMLDSRVAKLEDLAMDTRERLARIETRLDSLEEHCATKADLLGLRADLHEDMNAQTWKFITATTTLATALVGAVYWITKHTT